MRLIDSVMAGIRGLLRPYPRSDLAPDQFMTPFDAAVQSIGVDAVEEFFAKSGDARRVVEAFSRYLDDPEAERSLKKGFHILIQDRMRVLALRADPPEAHGFDRIPLPVRASPLDPFAWAAISRALPESARAPADLGAAAGLLPRTRLMLSVVFWGCALVAKAAAIWVRRGRRGFTPTKCRVASADFGFPFFWNAFAETMAEAGIARREIVFIAENVDSKLVGAEGFTVFDPESAAVPAGAWLRRVLSPAVRLAFSVGFGAARGFADARGLFLAADCLHQAYLTLRLWRVFFNLQPASYLDIVEYNPIHNLKGILLRKFGGRLVRMPYSEADGSGTATEYLGYDLYLSGGKYPAGAFSRTAFAGCRWIPVGRMQMDHHLRAQITVAPEYRKAIESRLAAGQRMLVYFAGSSVPGFASPTCDHVHALWQEIKNRNDWFLVLKPKSIHDLFGLLRQDSRLKEIFDSKNVVPIYQNARGVEVCHVSYLIEKMSLGSCPFGTVQAEALTSGRPHMAYTPVVQESTYKNKLRECGLLHHNIDSFRAAVRSILDGTKAPAIPYDWFRENFNAFPDDEALSRVARLLASDPAEWPTSAPRVEELAKVSSAG